MSTVSNPSEKAAINAFVEENERQRQEIQELRKEREELNRNLRKCEGELKTYELKCKVLEGERSKQVNQTRRFMESLEQEKRERIKLLTESSELRNQIVRKEAEMAKYNAELSTLTAENQRQKKQLETLNTTYVTALKERQSTVNESKILSTKLQAESMEKKFLTGKLAQAESELSHVRAELTEMTKNYHEKQLGVQEIYKDDKDTKQLLLLEFQHKMSDKDEETKNQLEGYIKENSRLKVELIELKNLLAKRN